MKHIRPTRFSLREYQPHPGFVTKVAKATGLPPHAVLGHLATTAGQLDTDLRLGKSPFVLERSTLKVEDVAGLVRCAPSFELEIVPKFLDSSQTTWREDFFFIAALTRFGRVLPRRRVQAGSARTADVPTLVGSVMVDMFEANRRRPLRAYRSKTTSDYSADGSLEEETLVLPPPDGFLQTQFLLDRANTFSAAIRTAFDRILPDIRDLQLKARLSRAARQLPRPESRLRVSRLPRSVPSRHRRWQPLYELSRFVLEGYGVSYEDGRLRGPGFVLKTPKAWEDLLLKALKLGSQDLVEPQPSFDLGHTNEGKVVVVNPDASLYAQGREKILVDAKYKGRGGRVAQAVSRADLYESLAFAKAAQVKTVVLVYPGGDSLQDLEPGQLKRIAGYSLDGVKVEAVQVLCRDIGSRGGFLKFSRRLAAEIRGLAPTTPLEQTA